MSIQESWQKALKHTEVIRPRVKPLYTFETTHLPYVFLAESSVNPGDTVVRKGDVVVEKPSLFLPSGLPMFEGFEFEEKMHFSEDVLTTFFLVRGITFPSLKFNNKTDSLDLYEGRLSKAIDHYATTLQKTEDVHTGLITGTEDTWPFSVLIFICGQVAKSAEGDLKNLLEEYKRRGELS